jgi:membrane protein implicated in regulation of membrane protease activity
MGMTNTTMYVIWAVAIVVFGVLEGMTAQLVSIWFVLGSIAGLISAICNVPIIAQVVIFIAVTVITLALTRPIVKKRLNTKVQKTNADRCIGQDAVVIEDIDNLAPTGQVKTDGKVWTARSSDQNVIPKDSVVTVEKIDGVKLIVSRKI